MLPVRRIRGGDEERRPESTPDDSPLEASSAPGPAPGEESESVSRMVRELAQRTEEILAIAERSAEEIRKQAEASAARYLEERKREADRAFEARVRAADRDLEERARVASALREEAGRVLERIDALEQAASRALSAYRDDVAPQWPEASAGERPEAPVSHTAALQRQVPEEALLRAAQMAVHGSDRAEIERALSAEFGVEHPARVVDEILGR